jgi:endonuclease-3
LAARQQRALSIIELLKSNTKTMKQPMVHSITATFGKKPYLVLISCLLSLRAKDEKTLPICIELFQKAQTPQEMLDLSPQVLEGLFYSLGFYRRKAEVVLEVSRLLCSNFKGQVPSSFEALISLPGVGPKTANLVLAEGFDIPAICVDTHVHRISNRLGLVATTTPEETEKELQKVLPKHYWSEWNRLLVMWGQNICVPVSPFCSRCAIHLECERVGVKKSR